MITPRIKKMLSHMGKLLVALARKYLKVVKQAMFRLWQIIDKLLDSPSKTRRQIKTSIAVLVLAVLILFVLVASRKSPKKIQRKFSASLVNASLFKQQDITMTIIANGTVTPKVQLEIVPQVSGKVVAIDPQFKAGGFIAANATILQIEPNDYQLIVEQAQAGVAEAMVKLDMEKSEAKVALKEWQQLNPQTQPDSPLVLRKPQIRQAKAKLQSAKAALDMAKLNLDRTKLSLPVDVIVTAESVDLGQFVMTGKSVGKGYGIKAVEIRLPLEDRELGWFDIPHMIKTSGKNNISENIKGAQAEIKADFAGGVYVWKGYVMRSTGQIDVRSRFASVVIEVPNPFADSDKPPLLPGIFVEVAIKGHLLKNAIAIPRNLIHNGNEVWVIKDGRLYIKTMKFVRQNREYAYVADQDEKELMIVTSSLDVVTDGMKIRLYTGGKKEVIGEK